MYITVLAPLVTFVAVALAAGQPNPFSVPEGFALTAGKPTTLKWTPTTPGTVTLTLREGSSNNLDQGTVIKSNIPNSGSYTYTPPADTVRNSDYTIEIKSDSDPSQVNYTPYFVLDSSNTVASVSADSASASGTSSPSASDSSAAASTDSSSSAAASTSGASATDAAASSSASASASASSSASSKSSVSATNTHFTTGTVSGPTSTNTGAGSEVGSSSIPSSGAILGAVGQLNIQTGLLAILLSAVAAW